MSRVFVGDVQGCLRELELLLEAVEYDRSRDELCFVGDLINRGPDSAAVLRLAHSLDARCVVGNHEHHLMVRGAFAPVPPDPSRFPTCLDLIRATDRIELGEWIATWSFAIDFGATVMVHAAVPPSLWRATRWHPIEDAERAFAISARYCDARGVRPAKDWPEPPEPFAPWHEYYRGPWTVVYGHWARQGLHVAPRLRGLDTGCVYGGALSAWIEDQDRIVQVQAARSYYR